MQAAKLQQVRVVVEELKVGRADGREPVLSAVRMNVAEFAFSRDLPPPTTRHASRALEDRLIFPDMGHQEAGEIPADFNGGEKKRHLDVFVVRGLGRVFEPKISP